MSISAGSSDTFIPAPRRASFSGSSAMGKTVASGWLWRSQRVMGTMGVTISPADVSRPSLATLRGARPGGGAREGPAGHGDDGVNDLPGRRLQAKLRQLLGVHPWVFSRVVGEKDDAPVELAQLEDEALGAGEQLVPEVDGAVEAEDVALVEPLRGARHAPPPAPAS